MRIKQEAFKAFKALGGMKHKVEESVFKTIGN